MVFPVTWVELVSLFRSCDFSKQRSNAARGGATSLWWKNVSHCVSMLAPPLFVCVCVVGDMASSLLALGVINHTCHQSSSSASAQGPHLSATVHQTIPVPTGVTTLWLADVTTRVCILVHFVCTLRVPASQVGNLRRFHSCCNYLLLWKINDILILLFYSSSLFCFVFF